MGPDCNILNTLKDCRTLFLDRDGVINERIMDGYVLDYKDFVFKEGVMEALKIFDKLFDRIFIVSNQQCIGKGLISEQDFLSLNEKMILEIEKNNARIDKVYYCPYLKSSNSILRKPKPGMAFKAKEDYPEVEFKKSIMVGDADSDMVFGKGLQMYTVFIDNHTGEPYNEDLVDLKYDSLWAFAKDLIKKQKPIEKK